MHITITLIYDATRRRIKWPLWSFICSLCNIERINTTETHYLCEDIPEQCCPQQRRTSPSPSLFVVIRASQCCLRLQPWLRKGCTSELFPYGWTADEAAPADGFVYFGSSSTTMNKSPCVFLRSNIPKLKFDVLRHRDAANQHSSLWPGDTLSFYS